VNGRNRIAFRMLEDGDRIQLDLFDNMAVDSVLLDGRSLTVTREHNAVFVDFPETLRRGEAYAIDFHWSGHPAEQGRFGGMVFRADSVGDPWVFTANQGIGASLWWPNKDQQPDEVDSMTMRVTVPTGLTEVSNGRFLGSTDLGDGTTRFDWKIHYPINNYSVSINIARYEHFSDTLGDVTLDFWALPYHLEAARRQFAQAKPMLECFERYFGPYPFPRDGYKLIEVAYSGMEHQSAVTYGNLFENGYLARDWTGVGISPRFDFIIVHESGHEWFGNSVTANDVSDAWIQEGFDTYAEAVYVECMWGYEDAMRYVNGYQEKVANEEPIVGPAGVNHWPTQDQYFKGALFLNTLRHVVDDDQAWWALLKDYAGHFQYRNIWTTDVINFFNERLDRDLRPVFEQYLYHAALPVLELELVADSVRHRWRADVEDFDMPVRVRAAGELRTIHPTTEWAAEPLDGVAPEDWQPATDLFYIAVERR
jgi:aminopeptidase N